MELEEWLRSKDVLGSWKAGFKTIEPPFVSERVSAKSHKQNLWAEYRAPYPEIRLIAFCLDPSLSIPRINCRIWFYAEHSALRERFLSLATPTLLSQKTIRYNDPAPGSSWKSQLDAEAVEVRGIQYDVVGLDAFKLPANDKETQVLAAIENYLSALGEAFLSWVDEAYRGEVPAHTVEAADALDAPLHESTALSLYPDDVEPVGQYLEGAVHQVLINAYERDPKARQACIDHYGLSCQACGMSFEAAYGVLGVGFIHVHHEVPLCSLGEAYAIDPIQHLKPLCPNCHAMVHRTYPPLSIASLRQLITSRAEQTT